MEYFVWHSKDEGNSCMLDSIQGLTDSWRLKEGIPLTGEFPDDVFFAMSERHPKDIKLTDSLINMDSAIVVSAKLKAFIESKDLGNVEFLRVNIMNHKGAIASDDYYIVNPIGNQDCLDLDESGPDYNKIVPTDIDFVAQLVLKEDCVDAEIRFFRLANFLEPVLIREDLAEEITSQGFKGIYFEALDEYEG